MLARTGTCLSSANSRSSSIAPRMRSATVPAPRASVAAANGVEQVAQFPIGGPERWRQLVENLAALVGVLDAGFVPEIEAAAGPTPAWYQPKEIG